MPGFEPGVEGGEEMKMIEDVDSLDIQSHLRIEDLWTPATYLKHQRSGDDWRILDV